jgi:hypothetical protein
MTLCFLFFALISSFIYLKVFADLLVDSHQLQMVTVAAALQEIGYEFWVIRLPCIL